MLNISDLVKRVLPQDFLFPFFPRRYSDFMDEISPEDLYVGLLGYGLFADKLPPMFSSKSFARHCMAQEPTCQKEPSNWITFSYTRNTSAKREFGIPSPFAYEALIRHLSNKWTELRTILVNNTAFHPYRISRIHIRRRKNTKSLFKMSYKSWQIEEDPLPTLLIGSRYVVECDVSRCFPSIYTHALDWAILGKERAKKNRRGGECKWSHDLDLLASNTTNGETHGLLVGPHASNLMAELILTNVDKALFDQGYRFVRYIDDYECFVDDEMKARAFVFDLEKELAVFGLSTNQKKTDIKELPRTLEDDWVRSLKEALSPKAVLDKSDLARFLDAAISIMRAFDNGAVLSYAFSMLAGCEMNYWARRHYGDVALHLAYIYPYLLPFMEEKVFYVAKVPSKRIAIFSNLLYEKSLRERDYLSAAYAIYYALKFDFDLDHLGGAQGCDDLIASGDCILLVCAWVYAHRKKVDEMKAKLVEHAVSLADDEDDFQKNWLFIYEVLDVSLIPAYLNGAWRGLKRQGVSFIDTDGLGGHLKNEEEPIDIVEALRERTSDETSNSDRLIEHITNEV
ncbi:MAG: RNA-directed DNA polymerase [Adlercreutzia sp.]|nr:RNA-directed DNA polymerase [Adlercreutzia sp.]